MKKSNLYFGETLLHPNSNEVSMETVEINEETYFKIENYDKMNPFFMTIVSDVDFWMFVSSTGGLTAGRKSPETALFPYYTDDKIHDSSETTGSHAMFIVDDGDKRFLWKPFCKHHDRVYKVTRNLYKNTIGNKIMFEEINHDLGVIYRYTWKTSNRFGIVKSSELVSLTDKNLEIRLLDGMRNILPYGVDTLLQTTRSTLADGYKRCELQLEHGLGIFTLSSIISDRAEPSEALKATTVWTKGIDSPIYLLSEEQVEKFAVDGPLETEMDIKGRRGAFYISSDIQLNSKAEKQWCFVSELNQSASDIAALMVDLSDKHGLLEELSADVKLGDDNLRKLVFMADGFQMTAKPKETYRHFSNTLFNIMRGGIYADEYNVLTEDLRAFVQKWNGPVYNKHEAFLSDLDDSMNYNVLLEQVEALEDVDLHRLVLEYLPLTYSRRHGDPSRPWNKFNIEVFKENGDQNLNFEGNWRDIFQNWEALSMSYPAYIESIIAKFVNASTVDGYNPYRITKEGIDWEVLDPEDPWSNIGYWGDHQIIYLLKLMELSNKYNPGKLADMLGKDIFVYADVPYRIKGFDDLVKDPRDTIIFDDAGEEDVKLRTGQIGSDGKLVHKQDGLYHVNLLEKLLVTFLSKLSNYVPEGGIWMNTQRPEWNDANNALVGNGISMVTLYYMHRFQVFMTDFVGTMTTDLPVSQEVYDMFVKTLDVFKRFTNVVGKPMDDQTRFEMVEALGRIGEAYRKSVYDKGFSGNRNKISSTMLKDFFETTQIHLKDTIQKNKREDGLYHAYNLISFSENGCHLSYLYEMLEGQVAALSSKAMDSDETLAVLKALRDSAIYREDQNSYMLYPNRALPEFLVKNIIPESMVQASVILKAELEKGSTRFVEQDINGLYHFNGLYRNGEELMAAIEKTGQYEAEDIKVVGEMFSELFNHHAFTGRSGTFYKYEGLGCIYWHMVSKLVLSAQEGHHAGIINHDSLETTALLSQYYHDLKAGIGVDKTPENYGAFPTDAYSHTPGFAGVQQPGMTGQVKEDFISRFGELGVEIHKGEIHFKPRLLSAAEFLTEKTQWILPTRVIDLEEGQLAFTLCSVPVIYSLTNEDNITICYKNGDKYKFENCHSLNREMSRSIFNRSGDVSGIHVCINKRVFIA